MKRIIILLAVLGCATTTLACSSDGDGDGLGSECSSADRSGYPAAPYGISRGATIESFVLPTASGGTFDLQAVHANGENHTLLISTAAGWCTACIAEQPELQSLATRYGDAGLVVAVSVFQDGDFVAATESYARSWRDDHNLSIPVLVDSEFIMSAYYDESLTPLTMLVDLNDMQIIYSSTGFDRTTVESIIDSRACVFEGVE